MSEDGRAFHVVRLFFFTIAQSLIYSLCHFDGIGTGLSAFDGKTIEIPPLAMARYKRSLSKNGSEDHSILISLSKAPSL